MRNNHSRLISPAKTFLLHDGEYDRMNQDKPTLGKKLRILLVDDEPADVLAIRRQVEKEELPFWIDEAASIAGAKELLKTEKYDLALVDNNLPDGVAQDLLAALDRTPAIVITGAGSEIVAAEAMRAGAYDYLIKDVELHFLKVLSKVIDNVMERSMINHTLHEMALARKMQRSLFPPASCETDRLSIAGESRPADDTGGDYYDYFPLPDGRMSLLIADVCGHGLAPALVMVQVRAFLRGVTSVGKDLCESLDMLNDYLSDGAAEKRFVTFMFGAIDPHARSLYYVSAGHPAGIMFDRSGKVKRTLSGENPPVGIMEKYEYQQSEQISLSGGDLIVWCTDGVLGAVHPQTAAVFETEQLIQTVQAHWGEHPQQIAEHVCDAAFAHYGANYSPEDDITVLVLKVKA